MTFLVLDLPRDLALMAALALDLSAMTKGEKRYPDVHEQFREIRVTIQHSHIPRLLHGDDTKSQRRLEAINHRLGFDLHERLKMILKLSTHKREGCLQIAARCNATATALIYLHNNVQAEIQRAVAPLEDLLIPN